MGLDLGWSATFCAANSQHDQRGQEACQCDQSAHHIYLPWHSIMFPDGLSPVALHTDRRIRIMAGNAALEIELRFFRVTPAMLSDPIGS